MSRQMFEIPEGTDHAFVILKRGDQIAFLSLLETSVIESIPLLWRCYFNMLGELPKESKLTEGFLEIIGNLVSEKTRDEVDAANRALTIVVKDLFEEEK